MATAMKWLYRCLLSAAAILFAAGLFIAGTSLFFVYKEKIPVSVQECAQKLGCPTRSTEELETSVKEYFKRDLHKEESFALTHEFYPAKNFYTADSALWRLPFSVVNPQSNERENMTAIVDCKGRVKISSNNPSVIPGFFKGNSPFFQGYQK